MSERDWARSFAAVVLIAWAVMMVVLACIYW